MMKSPSHHTDSSSIPDTNQMNTERRISWQGGQYQFSRPPQPGQYPAPDGQVPPRPPFYPEKADMYATPPNYAAPPSMDPNAWQATPPAAGMDQYSQGRPSPAHSTGSQYNMEHREVPNSTVNANGISAAAAAAAAAMAAAAHSAKLSPGYQKPPNVALPPPNAMHGKPMPVPVQQRGVPFHPNYANVQQAVPPPAVPPTPQDPGLQNHSSPYQPSPGPPPPMNRHMGGPQYSQWGPQQPPNPMDYRPAPGYQQSYDNQMQGVERMPFPENMPHGPMSNASSHDSEESRPKSSARASSQKISALYEPDEPGRKDFVDRVLRYWEEKELPLKHAPMMAGRTLDLYVLYQHVKRKGFMQEVTRSKEWSEISNGMGLGNTSNAGFTLKKQYCKYLYGFECHFERGEPEPQEALARVIEANRKKKQIAEQNQVKAAENSHHHEFKPGEDPHSMTPMPQHTYPGQHHESPYRPNPPPGGMPYHHPMPNMHPGYGGPGHNHSVPHGPPAAPYDQHQQPGLGYPPMNTGWQQGPQYQPHRPPMPNQPRYPYRSNGIPQNYPGPHYMPQQTNSLDHGQVMPPRPRFSQPSMHNQAPPIQSVPIPPEIKPQPNHSVAPVAPVTSTNSSEIQNAVATVGENLQDQKVQDLVVTTAASQLSVATETTQANSNATTPTSTVTITTPSEKPDVPLEQNTTVPSSTPAVSTPTEKTTVSVSNKVPVPQEQAATAGTPKPATPQLNTQTETPNATENTPTAPVPPKMEFMKSPEQQQRLNNIMTPSYKPRPEMSLVPPQMNSHIRGPPPRQYPPNSSTMGPEGYQPSTPYHRPMERPMGPGIYPPPQSAYHPAYPQYHGVNPNQPPNDSPYYGQKRLHHSIEPYGPRSKIPRPDPNMYNMQYRDGYEMQRRLGRPGPPPPQRHDTAAMPHPHHYSPYNVPGMVQQPPGVRHYGPPPPQHPNYPHTPRHLQSSMTRSNSPSVVAMSMHNMSESQKPRPPHLAPPADSATKFLQGLVGTPPPRPQPGHLPSGTQPIVSSPYPVGSVEAVVPSLVKTKDKTAHDIGVIEAWQVILSLKSGLLAESSWALNALSVLLHDKRSVGQIMLSQLPGLLHALIEHYRYCLHQLFGILDFPNSQKSNKLDDSETESGDVAAEKITSDTSSKCKASPSNLTMDGKQLKYLPAPSRLQNPYSKLPVKVVEGENRFPLLLDTLWNNEYQQDPQTSSIIPIATLNSSGTEEPAVDMGVSNSSSDSKTNVGGDNVAELTFEDMLSIPSFIRCLAQNQIVSFENDTDEKETDFSIFPEIEKKRIPQKQNPVVNGNIEPEKQTGGEVKDQDITNGLPVEDVKPVILQHTDTKLKDPCTDDSASHIQSCLGRFIWSCDVALLEEEAAGFPGNSGFKAPSGVHGWRLITRGLEYIFPKKTKNKDTPEMVLRILSLSNIIRSLSCVAVNHTELFMHPDFFNTVCSTLLLGHKHRVRHVKPWRDVPMTETNTQCGERDDVTEHSPHAGCRNNDHSVASALSSQNFLDANEIDENRPLKEAIKREMVKNAVMSCKNDTTDTITSNHFCPSPTSKDKDAKCETVGDDAVTSEENDTSEKTERHDSIFAPKPKMTFSSTVLNENLNSQDSGNIYQDPWWWDCVRQLREDSLVTLANLSMSLDISLFPNDNAMLTILDACLHWAVCSSADAQDPFPSSNHRTIVSAQSLGIEILTKLSMKEGNVDLILATRPYARLEKLFKKLTIMVGNRKDQTLREFSIVLLSNLCNEPTAARAIALQAGAVSNFLSFLEECEETGLNNQRMFPAGQEMVNCGTVSYIMHKCALTLLKLAKLEENRPLFLKHHLRLLSLSMSILLGRTVLSLVSAVLFELSREPPNR